MGTKLTTVSVRLNEEASARLAKAAELRRQSKGAFLALAGEAAAERALMDWAVGEHGGGRMSLSELAAETGLVLEAIAEEIGRRRGGEAVEIYLASCRKLAEDFDMPEFYAEARRAASLASTGTADAER